MWMTSKLVSCLFHQYYIYVGYINNCKQHFCTDTNSWGQWRHLQLQSVVVNGLTCERSLVLGAGLKEGELLGGNVSCLILHLFNVWINAAVSALLRRLRGDRCVAQPGFLNHARPYSAVNAPHTSHSVSFSHWSLLHAAVADNVV